MTTDSPSQLIDARIEELGDWRGETLARVRALIKEADPEVVEEWKWRGVPTWEHDGIICTGETYKNVVKMTFAKGASLDDPSGLFNSSLEGNTRRAIDIHEGDEIDEEALKDADPRRRGAEHVLSRGGDQPARLTAFFTSAAIFFSSAAVSSFSANEVGHISPLSRFARSLKPSVAYLDLNFCALWKKQTTLPSLA